MRYLKDSEDIELFWNAVDSCEGDVYLCSADGTEEFNLKSVLSRYIAIGELSKEHGDEYEIFCSNKADEIKMINFVRELKE